MPKKKKPSPILYVLPGVIIAAVIIGSLLSKSITGIIIAEGFSWFICTALSLIAGLIIKEKMKNPELWIPILIITFITGIYSIVGPIKNLVNGSEMTFFSIEQKYVSSYTDKLHLTDGKYYIICSPIGHAIGDGLDTKTKFRVPKEVFDKVEEGSEYILTYYRNIKVVTKAEKDTF